MFKYAIAETLNCLLMLEWYTEIQTRRKSLLENVCGIGFVEILLHSCGLILY